MKNPGVASRVFLERVTERSSAHATVDIILLTLIAHRVLLPGKHRGALVSDNCTVLKN